MNCRERKGNREKKKHLAGKGKTTIYFLGGRHRRQIGSADFDACCFLTSNSRGKGKERGQKKNDSERPTVINRKI